MAEEGESVQVAVRMRIFNGRETTAGATRIVRMTQEDKGSKTYIKHPDTGAEKVFAFDYSFQSHSETEQGIGPYATQDTVFESLGKPVLYSALEGRNICLFAYGQTGAGKSFSMLGKAEPKEKAGIIPRSCVEIFRLRDEERDDPLVKYNVSIQVVEVYCEMVNDLLEVRSKWPPNGHKPRLTKDGYVVDTVTRPCASYPDIEKAIMIADKNRSVGSHALNPESSRAHTIYTINYQRQKKLSEDAKNAETVSAKINLVDLAGSERSESAGTSGQMLKEGNAINTSLTALGGTIKALSEGKKPNFRDSKLTLLLQGSMTNGKVIMIAAVSPASICYDESVSTLRFAERIKMVKIKAKKNVTQDPVAEIKKEMEEMRQKMQEEIDGLKAQAEGKSVPTSEKTKELQALLDEQDAMNKQLQEDYEARMAALASGDDGGAADEAARAEMDAAFQAELGQDAFRKVTDIDVPHIRNLAEDPRLAETMAHSFKEGETRIGRSNKDNPPDIEFNGLGIIKDHCVINWDKATQIVTLVSENNSQTMVNGKKVVGIVQISHNSRIWLGNNYAFRFVFPGQEARGEKFEVDPDYLFAESELANQFQDLPAALGHQLSEGLKKVEQANIIAADLKKPTQFKAKIIKNRVTKEDDVVVLAIMPSGSCIWPWAKFNLRLTEMVQLWQRFQAAQEGGGEAFVAPTGDEDPFEDSEPQLIGEADVWIKNLENMLDNEADSFLLNPLGDKEGRVQVDIKPLDEKGEEGPWEGDREMFDPFVESAAELLDQEIQYVVRIKGIIFEVDLASGGQCKYEECWVRYRLNISDREEEWKCTDPCKSVTFTPTFNSSHKYTKKCDKEFLDSLATGRITFQVWGKLRKEVGGGGAPGAGGGGGGGGELAMQFQSLSYYHNLIKNGAPKLPEGWELSAGFYNPATGQYMTEKPSV